MAGIKSKTGDYYNLPVSEYTITSKADIKDLPTTKTKAKGKFANNIDFEALPSIGSICKVVTGQELIIYMLGEEGWFEI